jgi:hypothetical protein
MTEKEAFQSIIKFLLNQNYKIDPNSFSYDDLNDDKDPLAKRVRLGMEAVNFFAKILDFNFESELKPAFKSEKFKEDLKRIYPITNYVLFKYVLAQPVIVSLVKADHLSPNDYKTISGQYDKVMLSFREHTGKIMGTKLSVTGLIFFIFSDSVKAAEFEEKYQAENKIWHFWKKTWTIPWAIDVSKGRVIKHKKLPVLVGSVIDAKKLESALLSMGALLNEC